MCNDYILSHVPHASPMTQEITVPLGVREFLPHWVHETVLGDARGAQTQYRYGNLHIRKYENCYKIHVDHTDPRKSALGHLVHDAPEFLIAAALAAPALASYYTARQIKKRDGESK